jgi:hypothetical protein
MEHFRRNIGNKGLNERRRRKFKLSIPKKNFENGKNIVDKYLPRK